MYRCMYICERLPVGRRRQRDDPEHPWADPLGDPLDDATLARAVATLRTRRRPSPWSRPPTPGGARDRPGGRAARLRTPCGRASAAPRRRPCAPRAGGASCPLGASPVRTVGPSCSTRRARAACGSGILRSCDDRAVGPGGRGGAHVPARLAADRPRRRGRARRHPRPPGHGLRGAGGPARRSPASTRPSPAWSGTRSSARRGCSCSGPTRRCRR